ncbi:MAG: Rne/Rng family ribonuclease [Deltaproteobacteria bacterium]|nr:Rne/Rng family ribonuclease [Deltaproteobacteria bacterium]
MSLDNFIAINVSLEEIRVSVIENGMIAELLLEREYKKSRVGNIYKGRVTRVLPGMQAAFIDIGFDKQAFLHLSDFSPAAEKTVTGKSPAVKKTGRSRNISIKDFLKEGQYIPVQVAKEEIGTKGCRVTSDISLAGRHLVMMPMSKKGGVSRKIEDDGERKRLVRILERFKSDKGALIARTAAMGASADSLEADSCYLIETWDEISKKFIETKKEGLLYKELSLPLRVARDKFNSSISKIIVDEESVFNDLKWFFDRLIPGRLDDIELYTNDEPLFEAFGIDGEIKRALERVVELPSGGTLVIDQGEALTAIDVNTGKFVGKGSTDQESTILKTNLEAVEEIAYQMRFRNIGGLIVADIIDMDRPQNREKVAELLREKLKNDRAKTSVNEISNFGLLEMTRERKSESLGRMLHESCPFCDGTGNILSRITVANEVLREIKKISGDAETGFIQVTVHPNVEEVLKGISAPSVKKLKQLSGKKIVIEKDIKLHPESYRVYLKAPVK